MRVRVLHAIATIVLLATLIEPALAAERSRWPIKTSLPENPREPAEIGLTILRDLPLVAGVRTRDARYNATRIPGEIANGLREGDLVATVGDLWLVAAEPDGDYHMQVSAVGDRAACLIVEVPDPQQVTGDDRVRAAAARVRVTVRVMLQGREPARAGTSLGTPRRVRLVGQLFYDDVHVGTPARGKRGCRTRTLWELHPVVDIMEVPR